MKVVINVNGHVGRPYGSTKMNTKVRDGYIIKAFYAGFKRKQIAEMMGLSYITVCKAIKESK